MPDVNTAIRDYLLGYYTLLDGDLTTLVRRYLDEQGVDATAAMRGLVALALAPPAP